MQFVLIDYSEHYYGGVEGTVFPPARKGKFIQVRRNGAEYLVLSPWVFTPYHANIAERFFNEQGVRGAYNRKRDHYKVKSEDWVIVGGGFWEANDTRKALGLSGESMAYGAFDPEGLRERLQATKKFAHYRIRVNS